MEPPDTMPIPRSTIRLGILGAILLASGRPGGAELIFPSDPRATLAEVDAALRRRAGFTPAYPRPASSLCDDRDSSALPALARACAEGGVHGPIHLTLNLGAHPPDNLHSLGMPFETFEPGWGSVRVDAEVARNWARMPPAAGFEIRHAFSPRVFAYFRIGLRRDLAAWHRDGAGLNLPLSSDEVDINEPSLGYLSYSGEWLEASVGRLPVHWGPSSDFSLTLSDAAVNYDAVSATLKGSRLRYRFLVAGLNPWLEGTPSGDTSGTDYPVGSEEWRQRHYPDLPGSENAHRRVYDARSKTLLAHRLETFVGPLSLGITETQIIGGKVPSLRDANPFAIFHNDFHEGYANNNLSIDALLRLPSGISLAAEVFMDDLEWSATEGEGVTPSLLGYLGALRHAFPVRGWLVTHSLHAVYTDPYLYGFLQPLNTYASRRVLTSNMQEKRDVVFVDKYVVDQPIGYLRGGDAFDLWWRAEAFGPHGEEIKASLALLARGEAGSRARYEDYFTPHGSAPSGVEEREFRAGIGGSRTLPSGLRISAAAAFLRTWNADHLEGRVHSDARVSAGIAYRFPR